MANLSSDFLRDFVPPPGQARLEERDEGPGAEPGLAIRVTDKGVKSWSVRYRNAAGEHRRKTIGPFPAFGLAAARTEARKIKGLVAGKTDVVGEEKKAKQEAAARKLRTVDGLAEAYWTACELGMHRSGTKAKPKRPATITEDKRIYDKHIHRKFGDTPVADMERADIQAFVDKESKRKAGTGRQCRDVIRQLLSYAVRQGLVPYNAGIGVGAISSTQRDRVLNDIEIKTLWAAFQPGAIVTDDKGNEVGVSAVMGCALRMGMAVMQRGFNVVSMRWDEIDRAEKLWSIPGDKMKNKRPHVVPLSELALELLDEAAALQTDNGSQYVFASPQRGEDDDIHLERRAFSRAMARIVAALKIPRATPHDFRRTGASNITSKRIGMTRFIAGQVLAHTEGGVTAIYDRYEYLDEKRHALDAWAALLAEIVSGEERPSNVSPLRAAAAHFVHAKIRGSGVCRAAGGDGRPPSPFQYDVE